MTVGLRIILAIQSGDVANVFGNNGAVPRQASGASGRMQFDEVTN